MAVPIAATTRITEIAPTILAAPSVPGKFSRVIPRAETVTAQIASSPPQT